VSSECVRVRRHSRKTRFSPLVKNWKRRGGGGASSWFNETRCPANASQLSRRERKSESANLCDSITRWKLRQLVNTEPVRWHINYISWQGSRDVCIVLHWAFFMTAFRTLACEYNWPMPSCVNRHDGSKTSRMKNHRTYSWAKHDCEVIELEHWEMRTRQEVTLREVMNFL